MTKAETSARSAYRCVFCGHEILEEHAVEQRGEGVYHLGCLEGTPPWLWDEE